MIEYTLYSFHRLSPEELYEILQLRQKVFIVEQNCPYLDCDGLDRDCFHLCGRNESGVLVSYTRILPPGIAYEGYAAIGRVVTDPSARGGGHGKMLMRESIAHCKRLFGENMPIKIGAQTYLLKFYTSLGFQSTGEEYLEDGIPHTKMTHP